MINAPPGFHQFTRHQYRLFLRLRNGDNIETEGMRRETIDALVAADVAYETDTGWLKPGPLARSAILLTGYCIQIQIEAMVEEAPR